MAKDHGSRIRAVESYKALCERGASYEKAARIAQARADPDMHPSQRGGKALPYGDWTKDEPYERAQELDIEGRSDMTKGELIDALRNH